jgi:hypothetical protein
LIESILDRRIVQCGEGSEARCDDVPWISETSFGGQIDFINETEKHFFKHAQSRSRFENEPSDVMWLVPITSQT